MKPLDDKEIVKAMADAISKTQAMEIAILEEFLEDFKKVIDGDNVSVVNSDLKKRASSIITNYTQDIKQPIYDFVIETNDIELKRLISEANSKSEDEEVKLSTLIYEQLAREAHKNAYKDVKDYIILDRLSVDGKRNLVANFNAQCQKSLEEIINGVKGSDQAINEIIEQLSKGLKVIQYNNVTRNVDVFVRQLCYWTQRESTNHLKEQFAKDNGLHIWEFTAHADARPTHQLWQGKRYDDLGIDYPTHQQLNNFEDETDYNCRHRKYPRWSKDDKYMFSKDELKNINSKPFKWGDKELDGYQQTQRARSMERRIRELKRKNILEPNHDTEMLIRKKTEEYKTFMKKCGTYPREDRIKMVD